MTYKIEVPVPNNVHFTERTLSAFIDMLDKYKDNIESLYFPLGHISNDIDVWGIRSPEWVYDDNGELEKTSILNWERAIDQIVGFTNIPVKILMNNIYHPSFNNDEDLKLIKKKLTYYKNKFNIKSVVVSDFTLIPFLQEQGLKITLSTNSHNSLNELDMALMLYDIDEIVLQRDLNRNPKRTIPFLQHRNLMDKTVLMVNEGCINACPYKNSGDVEIGISDVKSKFNKIHSGGCTILNQGAPWTFLTSQFLTKSMVEQYYPDIKVIKLAGRNLSVSEIKKQLQHYVDGTDHKLSDILNVYAKSNMVVSDLSDEYTKDVMTCNKECSVCRKCKVHYELLNDKHLIMSIPDIVIESMADSITPPKLIPVD